MKDKSDIIQAQYFALSTEDPKPFVKELDFMASEYIPFGSDNLFPQALALFSRTSPNHRGILNSKHQYIIGDGIAARDEKDSEVIELLRKVNFEGENITGVVSRILIDDLRFGNSWWELITDRNQTFLWFNQLDSTKCRLGKDEKTVVIHPDWTKYMMDDKAKKTLTLYPNFQKDKGTGNFPAYRSVFHHKRYEPEFVYYGIPDYIAGKDSVQIDLKTNKWNLARLKNSFRLSGILVIPTRDKAESKQVIDRIKKDFIGEDNQAKLLTITKLRARSDEKADQTQLIETRQDDEGSWTSLHSQSFNDMIVAHGWFRSLVSSPDNTGFDTQRILNEYEIAYNTVISSYQDEYINLINKFYDEILGRTLDIQFKNKAPMDDDKYKYVWEVRKEKGLAYDENDPAQQEIIGTKTGIKNISVS